MHLRTAALATLALCAVALAGAGVLAQPGRDAAPAAPIGPGEPPTAPPPWPEQWPASAGVALLPRLGHPASPDGGHTLLRTGTGAGSPLVPLPPPVGAGDATVLAVGDSVLEGTSGLLDAQLVGWDLEVDALQGRSVPDGLRRIGEDRSAQVVVVVLGHNYEGAGAAFAWFEDLRARTRSAERVVVATVAEWSPAQVEVNQAVWLLAAADPRVVVADWSSVVKANPSYLRSDRVHLTPEGNEALARLLAALVGDPPEVPGAAD